MRIWLDMANSPHPVLLAPVARELETRGQQLRRPRKPVHRRTPSPRQVDGSVLWLLGGSSAVAANLRREANARGIAPDRVIFATRLGYSDYLRRYQLADLFLDTAPFNAGATASDALWAGLPLITCSGEAFAGRMAGSLLHALGLPQLVTASLEDYERIALRLATDRAAIEALKAKLAQSRTTCALFDTARFRRHIESAYQTMWQRHQAGEPPASFTVAPMD